MINMDGSSRDMSYDGWQHRLEFFAFTDETPGTASSEPVNLDTQL